MEAGPGASSRLLQLRPALNQFEPVEWPARLEDLHARLAAAGVPVIREPAVEPWGLTEMWIQDPDGIRIILVEVPADHPIRRDPRPASPPR